MGVITYDMMITSPISPTRMFQAFVLDADNLIPQVLPHAIESVEILQGDGGPGTIKLTTFGEAFTGSQLKSLMQRIDYISTEDLTYRYSIIEGDVLKRGLESISYVIKMEASDDDYDGTQGSICTIRSIYYTRDGDAQISEEQIRGGKEKAMAMFKAVEYYLQSNPLAYN